MGRATISSSTRLAGVIGRPIGHSLSPVIHNAAFEELGIDSVSLAFEVDEDGVASALAVLTAFDMMGLSVTMPCKDATARGVDRLSPEADLLGAVNCVSREDGLLVGHNTDGAGLVETLRSDEGFDPAGARCVVLGAGGAARGSGRCPRSGGSGRGRGRGAGRVACRVSGFDRRQGSSRS